MQAWVMNALDNASKKAGSLPSKFKTIECHQIGRQISDE